ncbi:TRAP transporter substrate-binding protein DctP [Pseudonocardia sp. KRD291]|uniref:TRAP transporter substrate-binding protein n=1 Tax=Pseudonocardia sp. KRD291 TaxID=2792007 RepID=UPI001C49E6A9|nr:TRAP transporter substrate-binding protein DctP [Pseudonocardia sp. KRD291]MBW0103276.1 TRAP transporter substrate-binding protein DctP [Pseudonocardia sp. KRD291]
MSRTTVGVLLAIGLLFATSACGVAREGPPGTTTLLIGDSYPPTHPASRDGVKFFMARAGELSGGRLRFEYFPSAQLGKAEDHLTLTRSGAVDIGVVSPPYLSDRMPLSNVADLPGMSTSACAPAAALTGLMGEGGILAEQEYTPQQLRMLFVGVQPNYEVMTTGAVVTEPSDMAGLQLRSSGGVLDQAVQALGAAPVSIAGPEMYEAMARGTVDGTALPPMSATPYRLDEVATNATSGAPLGSFTLTYAVSDRAWDRLPEDLRGVLAQAGQETTRHLCTAIEEENRVSRTSLEQGGLRFTELTDSQVRAWQDALAPVREQWVTDMEGRGLPGRAALDAMQAGLAGADRG